ncbi:hypothetical protein PG999_001043 [Apiospora kogelbergensis]|uniref:Uncharacterized protein n=1 Tax=Apiospora kogelbergensis TaxID=1337665 RepID=A0AAW0RD81_9PEZI
MTTLKTKHLRTNKFLVCLHGSAPNDDVHIATQPRSSVELLLGNALDLGTHLVGIPAQFFLPSPRLLPEGRTTPSRTKTRHSPESRFADDNAARDGGALHVARHHGPGDLGQRVCLTVAAERDDEGGESMGEPGPGLQILTLAHHLRHVRPDRRDAEDVLASQELGHAWRFVHGHDGHSQVQGPHCLCDDPRASAGVFSASGFSSRSLGSGGWFIRFVPSSCEAIEPTTTTNGR